MAFVWDDSSWALALRWPSDPQRLPVKEEGRSFGTSSDPVGRRMKLSDGYIFGCYVECGVEKSKIGKDELKVWTRIITSRRRAEDELKEIHFNFVKRSKGSHTRQKKVCRQIRRVVGVDRRSAQAGSARLTFLVTADWDKRIKSRSAHRLADDFGAKLFNVQTSMMWLWKRGIISHWTNYPLSLLRLPFLFTPMTRFPFLFLFDTHFAYLLSTSHFSIPQAMESALQQILFWITK